MNSSALKWISIALFSVAATGCKQGHGERCQVDSDCSAGLTCSQAEPKTCGGDTRGQVDAETPVQLIDAAKLDAPIDAPKLDAPKLDAPIDAPIDAPP